MEQSKWSCLVFLVGQVNSQHSHSSENKPHGGEEVVKDSRLWEHIQIIKHQSSWLFLAENYSALQPSYLEADELLSGEAMTVDDLDLFDQCTLPTLCSS